MPKENFFNISKEQSQVKTNIVKKYFWAWAKVIAPRSTGNIAYIDLYSGPGIYEDGTKSTPILVLENALRDDLMKQKLVSIFNDTNPDFANSLAKSINSIPNIKELRFKPRVNNFTVGNEIAKTLKSMNLVPTLLFIDPWGYKGLSLQLIASVLKDWGCDCIFFFNYNRINAGLNNSKFNDLINSIFGEARARELREHLVKCNLNKKTDVIQREKLILRFLKLALKEVRGEYVLPFKFISENSRKTSHFLIFVSKNVLGYDIMKQIMAEESTYKYQNVSTFEFDPHPDKHAGTLFPPRPLENLELSLLKKFSSQKISVINIYQQHNIGTVYIKSNYKEILLKMESERKIIVEPEISRRRRYKGNPTLGDDVLIKFP